MLLLGKTQKKHPGDLLPTVPDLPLPPPTTFTTQSVSTGYYVRKAGVKQCSFRFSGVSGLRKVADFF